MMEESKGFILFSEENQGLAQAVILYFQSNGYRMEPVQSVQSAAHIVLHEDVSLCIIDLDYNTNVNLAMANDLRTIRKDLPILLLKSEILNLKSIPGYNECIDDYFKKPFTMSELLMKVEAFLSISNNSKEDHQGIYTLHDVTLDYHAHSLNVAGQVTKLTMKEARLLRYFFMHKDELLKREEILIAVWGKNDFFLGRSMDVYITRLRKYLKTSAQVSIETLHTIGYRLNTVGRQNV